MTIFAIATKYKGPTNTRGSRIYAKGSDYQTHIPYPHQLSGVDVYRAALADWLEKCEATKRFELTDAERNPDNWTAGWVGNDYVFVYGASNG